jgi:hypothetical protein
MGTIQEVIQEIEAHNASAFREATGGEVWSQEDVDQIWLAACSTCKSSLIKHALTLGVPDQDAVGESLIIMTRGEKEVLVLTYLPYLDDVDWQDGTGRTLMSHAVLGPKKIIAALLKRGADVTIVDEQGLPPIYYAMQAKKTKLAIRLLEYGVGLEGDVGKEIVKMAPTRELSNALGRMYVAQRASSMTRAEFVEEWGPVKQAHDDMVWPEVSGTGERFMKGEMYTVGYFPEGQDPTAQTELDWEAIDAAKTLANQLAQTLCEASCGWFSNADVSLDFHPFFIPSLGHSPGVTEFDAAMTRESLESGDGGYSTYIETFDPGEGGFDEAQRARDVEDGMISAEQCEAYKQVSALFNARCEDVREYRLYTNKESFPVIIGGLDEYYNFVGVMGEAVWR